MAVFLNRPVLPLLAAARQRLGVSQRGLAKSLGASERTSVRWAAGEAQPTVAMMRTLARLVYPRDAALAAEIAAAASETLVSLGIVAPPAKPAAPSKDVLRDAIVCTAAEAAGATPPAARAALAAAFARAKALGVSPAELEALVSPARPS